MQDVRHGGTPGFAGGRPAGLLVALAVAFVLTAGNIATLTAGEAPAPPELVKAAAAGASGPILHFSMENGTGSTVTDVSTLGNDHTTSGLAGHSWVAGRNGSWALSFNGAGNVAAIASASDLGFAPQADAFTVSAWFKTSSTAEQALVWKGTASGGRQYGLKLASGKLYGAVGETQSAAVGSGLADGGWHLATLVNEKIGDVWTFTVYLDGGATKVSATSGSVTNSYGPMLGRYGGGGAKLSGALDDVRVWNRALTAEEVGAIFNPGTFSVSAPTTKNVEAGYSSLETVTVTPIDGFTGAVALSATVTPAGSGITVIFTPPTVTLSGGAATSSAKITAPAAIEPGEYTVTFAGASGSLTAQASTTLTVTAGFILSASGYPNMIQAGQSARATIAVTRTGGYWHDVTLSASTAPSGCAAVTLTPTTVPDGTPSAEAAISVPAVASGNCTIIVQGAGVGAPSSHDLPITFVIATFSLNATAPASAVEPGQAITVPLTVTRSAGFSGDVVLAALVSPAGAATVTLEPVTVTSDTSSATATVTVPADAGSVFTLTFSGASGVIIKTAEVSFDVPTFTLAVSPVSAILRAGETLEVTVTAGALAGFANDIALSASFAPSGSGVTASFSAPTLAGGAGTSVATIAVPTAAAAGAYTVTFTGASGAIVKTATTDLTVAAAEGPSDTILHFSMENGTGSTVTDVSTLGNDHATSGLAGHSWVAGRNGSWALSFNGAGNVAAIASASDLGFAPQADAFTISAWFKTSSTAEQALVWKGTASGGRQYGLKLASGKLYGAVGEKQSAAAGSGLADGGWHLATLVNEKIGDVWTFTVYLDGGATKVSATSGSVTNSYGPMLGRYGGGGAKLSGALDDVRVWDRALTAAEVSLLFGETPAGLYFLSGAITTGGAGLVGVSVTAGGKTATTTDSGFYMIPGLANGAYTITPSKAGYTFSPASRNVTIAGADLTGNDFAATATPPATYKVSGKVTAGGSGLAGVTVSAGGQTAATSSTGAYTISGLVAGTYTVIPSLSGYAFTPPSKAVTISNANLTGISFTAGTCTAGSLALSISPTSITLTQGQSGDVTVTTLACSPLAAAIDLSISQPLAGVTAEASVDPIPEPGSGASVLTLKASSSATVGSKNVTILGVGGGAKAKATLAITVNPAPTFTMAVSPLSLALEPGGTPQTVGVTLTAAGGFSSDVALAVEGLPGDIEPAWIPSDILPGGGTATLSLAAAASANGMYNITVRALGGGVERSQQLFLTAGLPGTPTTPGRLVWLGGFRSRARLDWSPSVAATGILEYRIYKDNGLVGSTKGLRFTVDNLDHALEYHLCVVAVANEGTLSESACLTFPPLGANSDAAGFPDRLEGSWDADGDGIPNHLDPDSDNDSLGDDKEASCLARPLDVLFVLDYSGSMGGTFSSEDGDLTRGNAARRSLKRTVFDLSLRANGSRFGLVGFPGKQGKGVPDLPAAEVIGYTTDVPYIAKKVGGPKLDVATLGLGYTGTADSEAGEEVGGVESEPASTGLSVRAMAVDPDDPTGYTPTAHGLWKASDVLRSLGSVARDEQHTPVVVVLSDGWPTYDLAGRIVLAKDSNPPQVIDPATDTFGSPEQVRVSGHWLGSRGVYSGEPFADAMVKAEKLKEQTPSAVLYSVGIKGETETSFSAELLGYLAAAGQGAYFTVESDARLNDALVEIFNFGGCDPDGDGAPSYLDPDTDGDGILDGDEHSGGGGDIICWDDAQDSDGDEIPDCTDNDADNDGIPNYLDSDSDNDCTSDRLEGWADANGDGHAQTTEMLDVNANGVYDYLEPGRIPAPKADVSYDRNQVTLAWLPIKGASLYRVFGGKTGEPMAFLTEIAPGACGPRGCTTTITGLDNEVSYSYRMTAVASGGEESCPSSEVGATPSTPPPPKPSITVTCGQGLATLAWQAADGAGYFVYHSPTGDDGSFTLLNQDPIEGGEYLHDTATTGAFNYYRVGGINLANNKVSEISDIAGAYVGPPEITNLAASIGLSSATVTFNTAIPASALVIERATAAAGPWTTLTPAAGTTITLSEGASGLKKLVDATTSCPGSYWYRVAGRKDVTCGLLPEASRPTVKAACGSDSCTLGATNIRYTQPGQGCHVLTMETVASGYIPNDYGTWNTCGGWQGQDYIRVEYEIPGEPTPRVLTVAPSNWSSHPREFCPPDYKAFCALNTYTFALAGATAENHTSRWLLKVQSFMNGHPAAPPAWTWEDTSRPAASINLEHEVTIDPLTGDRTITWKSYGPHYLRRAPRHRATGEVLWSKEEYVGEIIQSCPGKCTVKDTAGPFVDDPYWEWKYWALVHAGGCGWSAAPKEKWPPIPRPDESQILVHDATLPTVESCGGPTIGVTVANWGENAGNAYTWGISVALIDLETSALVSHFVTSEDHECAKLHYDKDSKKKVSTCKVKVPIPSNYLETLVHGKELYAEVRPVWGGVMASDLSRNVYVRPLGIPHAVASGSLAASWKSYDTVNLALAVAATAPLGTTYHVYGPDWTTPLAKLPIFKATDRTTKTLIHSIPDDIEEDVCYWAVARNACSSEEAFSAGDLERAAQACVTVGGRPKKPDIPTPDATVAVNSIGWGEGCAHKGDPDVNVLVTKGPTPSSEYDWTITLQPMKPDGVTPLSSSVTSDATCNSMLKGSNPTVACNIKVTLPQKPLFFADNIRFRSMITWATSEGASKSTSWTNHTKDHFDGCHDMPDTPEEEGAASPQLTFVEKSECGKFAIRIDASEGQKGHNSDGKYKWEICPFVDGPGGDLDFWLLDCKVASGLKAGSTDTLEFELGSDPVPTEGEYEVEVDYRWKYNSEKVTGWNTAPSLKGRILAPPPSPTHSLWPPGGPGGYTEDFDIKNWQWSLDLWAPERTSATEYHVTYTDESGTTVDYGNVACAAGQRCQLAIPGGNVAVGKESQLTVVPVSLICP